MAHRNVLELFDVSLELLSEVVHDNPSLRGMILGYLAEAKLRELLDKDGKATAFRKDDDHDRKKKGDLVLTYRGCEFRIEVKSLQTNTIEIRPPGSADRPAAQAWIRRMLKKSGPGMPNPEYGPIWDKHRFSANFRGRFQCDASDRRRVPFSDGSAVETTNLRVGEFDILAAGLFAFREKWDFAFALNRDLPRCDHGAYTEHQRANLLKSMMPISWPVEPPFTMDIYELLDRLVDEKSAGEPAVKRTKRSKRS